MKRKNFIGILIKTSLLGTLAWWGLSRFNFLSSSEGNQNDVKNKNSTKPKKKLMLKRYGDSPIEKLELSKSEWKERLSPDEYHILREEGTEPPFTSPLDNEKREGVFYCAGCGLDLFTSKMKFDSGTGWPSFFTTIEARFKIVNDFKLIFPRKEYRCIRCDGHHGHVFKDGPAPTFQRWCNNGLALKFKKEKL